MSLANEYLHRHNGDRILAAIELARELMVGDPATFKQGYDAPNAALAAQELFRLDEFETSAVRRAVEPREQHWYEVKAWIRVKAGDEREAEVEAALILDTVAEKYRGLTSIEGEGAVYQLDDEEEA
jgi:hypothetical protein